MYFRCIQANREYQANDAQWQNVAADCGDMRVHG
jgi:hypothetical protein